MNIPFEYDFLLTLADWHHTPPLGSPSSLR
jgi:hypothetical protein